MASDLSFVEFVMEQLEPSFLIGDQIEDPQWLSELVRITARELPAPKPKKRKKKS